MSLSEHVTSVPWSALGGLRWHLAMAEARARAPAVLLAVAASVVTSGWAALPAALAGLSALALQACVSPLASRLIVPAQRRLTTTLQWAAGLAARAAAPASAPALAGLGLRDAALVRAARAAAPAGAAAAAARQLSAGAAMLAQHASVASAARMRAGGGAGMDLHCVRTPDGACLDVCVLRASGGSRGVLVYAGGNAELWPLAGALAAHARRHGLTAVLFDYRGVGLSEGTLTRAGGVVDVACVLAFCAVTLGAPPARTLIFGHSIGGAFSAEAARFMAPGAVVSDRSFGRLSDVANFHLFPPCMDPATAHELPARLARTAIYELIAHIAAWQLDSAEHWRHIPDARKIVIFHAHDGIIPLPAQLGTALAQHHGLEPALWGLPDGGAAAATTAAAAGCGGLGVLLQIGGADDAHNRDLSAAEADAFFTRVALPMLDVAADERAQGTLPSFLRL